MSAEQRNPKSEGLTGRHVLYAVLAFFGVIFLANGIFLYYAIGSYTGVVSNEPYRKGLNYNERIAADAEQKARGWSRGLVLAADGAVTFALKDRDGRPVSGLAIEAVVGRPTTSDLDVTVQLQEKEPGQYVGNVGKREDGAWLIQLEARRTRASGETQLVYRAKERRCLYRAKEQECQKLKP